MADISVHQPLIGAVYNSDEVELQRGDTEVSMKPLATQGVSNGNIVADDLGVPALWSEEDSGVGVSTFETFDSESVVKLTHTGLGLGKSTRVRNVGSGLIPSVFVATIKTYFESIGTNAEGNAFWLEIHRPNLRFILVFSLDGIFTHNGSGFKTLISNITELNVWNTWTIKVNSEDYVNAKVDLYKNGILAVANVDCSYNTAFTDGEVLFSSRQASSSTDIPIGYYEEILIGDDFCASFPTQTEITLSQKHGEEQDSQWKFSQITDLLENPNGEAGTVKYKYAVSNTTIPTYQDTPSAYSSTWLTLAELKAISETLTIGQYCRFAIQLSGDGSQDATATNFGVGVEIACPVIDFPDAGEVALDVDRGDGVLGTRTDANPDLTLVENGSYGNPSTPFIPVWRKADSALYKEGETFGINGTSETGSLVCLVNDVDDLRLGVLNADGESGTVREATEDKVAKGYNYGANDSLTGLLESIILSRGNYEIELNGSTIEVKL